MHKHEYILDNPKGLHARPSSLLVQEAMCHTCNITITKNDVTADAKSILGIMQLEALHNDHLIVTAEGPNEIEAVEALGKIFGMLFED